MKLVLLFGSSAVGKMTVGQELAKITDLKLFHNHMTIEPIVEIFGTYNFNVIQKVREIILEEYAKTDNYGLIVTFMWAFDCIEDWEITERIADTFIEQGAEVYYVELVAPQKIRLERNVTENRLKHKPSKQNIEFSNKLLIEGDKAHRFESYDGEIPFKNYIKIDNSNLSAKETARMIKDRFDL